MGCPLTYESEHRKSSLLLHIRNGSDTIRECLALTLTYYFKVLTPEC